jgi:hypothetical protein
VRVSDNNYANVLSRTKGDIFNERNSDVKRDVYARLESENIRSFSDFKTLLSEYGEVKARNAGKAGEYLSVKLDGDKKFTNLKNPLFSKQYVESRELPLIKPTEKQISARLRHGQAAPVMRLNIFTRHRRVFVRFTNHLDDDRKTFFEERIKSYDEKTNSTKSTLNQREDGRAVTSEVLIHLPDSIELKQESACHVCPNAVWFTESTDEQRPPNLSVYCRIMSSVIWQSGYKTNNTLVAKCDGILIDNKNED